MCGDADIDFSVVVPVRNAEATITRSVLLVSDQVEAAAGRGEVIVVDDQSTDSTYAALMALAALPTVSVIRHDERLGPNAARNSGVRAARGRELLFVDGDDEVLPGWLDLIREPLADPSVLVGGTYVVRQPGGWEAEVPPDSRVAFGFRYAVGGNMGCRRALFDAVDGFDENIMRGGSEVEFAIRAQQLCGVHVVGVPGARVRHRLPETRVSQFMAHLDRERGHHYIVSRLQAVSAPGDRASLHDERTPVERARAAGGWIGLGAEVLGRKAGRLRHRGRQVDGLPERRGASSRLAP